MPTLSVGQKAERVFVQRVSQMAQEPTLGAQAAEARALLARRGLNEQVVQKASDLLEQLHKVEPAAEPERDIEAEAAAEAALWSWYREWSEIARVAITDRRLLRELGFLGAKRGGARSRSRANDRTAHGAQRTALGAQRMALAARRGLGGLWG